MEPKKFRQNLEWQLQQLVIKELRNKGWYVIEMHASQVLSGMPDLYCTHSKYGQRWLELKLESKHCWTTGQKENFPKMVANGTKIWVSFSHQNVEDLLMKPSNFTQVYAGLY